MVDARGRGAREQNEINGVDAEPVPVDAGSSARGEHAGDPRGQDLFHEKGILYAPAANAGGVAVAALEMAQASSRTFWSREEVDRRPRHHEGHPPALPRGR